MFIYVKRFGTDYAGYGIEHSGIMAQIDQIQQIRIKAADNPPFCDANLESKLLCTVKPSCFISSALRH